MSVHISNCWIPYATVALIGVPLTATQPGYRRDLLILPHELGHYVYWHGQFRGLPVRNRVRDLTQDQPFFVRRWIEDIFADVCGFLISHEPAVLPAALSMLRDNAPRKYFLDNQVHPIDAVRLDIYLSTLQSLGKTFQIEEDLNPIRTMFKGRTDALDRIAGGMKALRLVDQHGKESSFQVKQVKEAVSSIVERIVHRIMEPTLSVTQWEERLSEKASLGPDETSITSPASLDKIDKLPSPFIERPHIAPILRLSGLLELVDVINDILADAQVKEWLVHFEKRMSSECKADVTSLPLPQSNQPHAFEIIRDTPFDHPLEPSVWKLVFAADGWTIKGPETGPVGGWEEEPDWTGSAFH